MRLIGVYWDEDRGVVDLDTAKVIMYCYGKIDSSTFNIPTVTLEDEDFRPLVPEDEEEGLYDEALFAYANWENVPALLALVSFNLESRLENP